jgi:hypothetical protein
LTSRALWFFNDALLSNRKQSISLKLTPSKVAEEKPLEIDRHLHRPTDCAHWPATFNWRRNLYCTKSFPQKLFPSND